MRQQNRANPANFLFRYGIASVFFTSGHALARQAWAILAVSLYLALGVGCVDKGLTPMDSVTSMGPGAGTGLTGSQFVNKIRYLNKGAVEAAIYAEAARGNVPSFLKNLSRVRLTGVTPSGKALSGTILVTKDYFAIGTDRDFVRVPMNPMTAQKIATLFGYILPTTKIVDEIFNQAEVRLKPNPLAPGPAMVTVAYFARHNAIIERQIQQQDPRRRKLTAGQKKDIVLTNKLLEKPKSVAIYGWHRSSGDPIQPLSTVHDNLYADYSHGVRLIWNMMDVNGKQMSVSSVLASQEYHSLLSHEGVLARPKILFAEPFRNPKMNPIHRLLTEIK